jgi:hypothetical protein
MPFAVSFYEIHVRYRFVFQSLDLNSIKSYVFPNIKFYETIKFFEFFLKYMAKMVGAGAGTSAKIFDKLEPKFL